MRRKIDLPLPTVDELFTTQEQRDDARREKILDVPIGEIDDFDGHPFQVIMDQSFLDSINTFGVQNPAILRQKEDGRYELVSGHRRKMASEIAGFTTLPCIVLFGN
jgi:ParB family chromosome partitioning protein